MIDLVRGDLLIEVQTRGFSSMRDKVAALLADGRRVRIVHPIAVDTWIVKLDGDGREVGRRRSPRHGTPPDVFAELVSIAPLLAHPNLEMDLVMIEAEEVRRHSPDGPWRRRGWAVEERRLVRVLGTLPIRGVADLATLVPPGLPDPFTTADLTLRLRRSRRLAQQMAYCLRLAGIFVAAGTQNRAVTYRHPGAEEGSRE